MDELDRRISEIVNKKVNTPEKYIETIRSTMYCKRKNKFKNSFIKSCAIASISCFFITGIVFAHEIENYIKTKLNFSISNGIDKAVENGYVLNSDDEPIKNNVDIENNNKDIIVTESNLTAKIDNFTMDDNNVSIKFYFQFDDNIKQYIEKTESSISFNNFFILDENNSLLFSQSKENSFNEFCKANNLDYTFGEFNENYFSSGVNYISQIIGDNSLELVCNMYSKNYPKSKNLKVSFNEIVISPKDINKLETETIILSGTYNFEIEVPEIIYNRKYINYEVISQSTDDIEVLTAKISDTNFEFECIIKNVDMPELVKKQKRLYDKFNTQKISTDELLEELEKLEPELQKVPYSYHSPIVHLYDKHFNETIDDCSYIENEEGNKFMISGNPGRTQEEYYIDDTTIYFYETFDLTKYDSSNVLKLQLVCFNNKITLDLRNTDI